MAFNIACEGPRGGFGKEPGAGAEILHSFYGVAGLSLMEHEAGSNVRQIYEAREGNNEKKEQERRYSSQRSMEEAVTRSTREHAIEEDSLCQDSVDDGMVRCSVKTRMKDDTDVDVSVSHVMKSNHVGVDKNKKNAADMDHGTSASGVHITDTSDNKTGKDVRRDRDPNCMDAHLDNGGIGIGKGEWSLRALDVALGITRRASGIAAWIPMFDMENDCLYRYGR